MLCRVKATGECVFMDQSCVGPLKCKADPTCLPQALSAETAEEPENECWADEEENICWADDYDEDAEK
jgi:hypothetical protein